MFHVDTTGMSWKSISITFEDHARLARLSREFGDAKLSAMFAACINAFEAITPEQQLAAIKGRPVTTDAPALTSLADARGVSLVGAASGAVAATSHLMTTVAEASADGEITEAEAWVVALEVAQ